MEYLNEFQKHERLAVRKTEHLFKDSQIFKLRKEMDEFHPYDITIQSGDPKTILLTEVKIRRHDYGYYDSTIIETFKYQNIMEECERLRSQYSDFKFIPSLLTFYQNNIHTLHLLESENYITDRVSPHHTAKNSEEIDKSFINYNIQNYNRKWVI